jgi:hypothetical protein
MQVKERGMALAHQTRIEVSMERIVIGKESWLQWEILDFVPELA